MSGLTIVVEEETKITGIIIIITGMIIGIDKETDMMTERSSIIEVEIDSSGTIIITTIATRDRDMQTIMNMKKIRNE